ncbi:MAG: hypothetical protein ACD_3C00142G0010 [uncultured bacterium (gcode 4)]|uniref:Uncharacterized protein n=1 Tax=uncultured bacterium (gcode 4) TaxID=1234023 RepID=K2GC81_9BACT|nr:MAG: hypothetical protein ACD_3C00142G0010 [uncultured bacterium (gcode 4)]
MSKETLNWAKGIDIWKDNKKDSLEFDFIKRRLAWDVKHLWDLKEQWKITKEEYDKYANKLKGILESNYKWRRDLDLKYETESKRIISEASWKTKDLLDVIPVWDKLRNYLSEREAKKDIEKSKKEWKIKIMWFDNIRHNYTIEIWEFENLIRSQEIESINSKALAEYLKYAISAGYNWKTLENKIWKYKMLHIAEIWWAIWNKNETSTNSRSLTNAQKSLWNDKDKANYLFKEYINWCLKNYQTSFDALLNIRNKKISTAKLILLFDRQLGRISNPKPEDMIRIIKNSDLWKWISENELRNVFKATVVDLVKAARITRRIEFKIRNGFADPMATLTYKNIIKKLDPNFNLNKLSKSDLSALNWNDKMVIDLSMDAKVNKIINILAKAWANNKVLEYFELYKWAISEYSNYMRSTDATIMGKREMVAMTKTVNASSSKMICICDSMLQRNTEFHETKRELHSNEDKFRNPLKGLRSANGITDIDELIKNWELVSKCIVELSKKNGKSKSDILLLKSLRKLTKKSIELQKVTIWAHTDNTEAEINAAIKSWNLKLAPYWKPTEDTLSRNKDFVNPESPKDEKNPEKKQEPQSKTVWSKASSLKDSPYAKELASSSLVVIPSSFSNNLDRTQFFNSIFSAIDEKESINIKLPDWLNFTLSKKAWSETYSVEYGWDKWIKHEWLSRKEVKNSLSFAQYTNSIWLGFLISSSREIIQKINSISVWDKILDKDWLSPSEKMLFLSIVWPQLIPGYIQTTSLEVNEAQFRNIKHQGKEISKKSKKLSGHIWWFSNLEELAKAQFPANGWKDFNVLTFLNSIWKTSWVV